MLAKLPTPDWFSHLVARLPLARRVVANPLVDSDWYRAAYDDVRLKGFDPAAHYRLHGWREGRDPNPLFSTRWYLARYPDVRQAGQDPLDHYLRHGGREGRHPSIFFDSAWYLERYPDVRASGINPLLHYLTYGHRESRLPRPLVDVDQPDVAPGLQRSGPLRRYLGRFVRRTMGGPDEERALTRKPVWDPKERDVLVSVLHSRALGGAADIAVAWATPADLDSVSNVTVRRFPEAGSPDWPSLISATAAVAHLEWLRHDGLTHLCLPESAATWLSGLPDLASHLERYEPSGDGRDLRIVDVRRPRSESERSASARAHALVWEFRDRELRDPAILDLWSGFDFKSTLPGARVFLPPTANGPPFPYADDSVDFVATPAGDDYSEREARRIATHGVLRPRVDSETRSWRLEIEMVGELSGVLLPSASIIVPTHNGVEFVRRCLASLDETVPHDMKAEIILVDDASDSQARDALAELVQDRPRVRLIRTDTNFGFVGAVNLAAEAASGDVLVLLNDDTITLPGWLSALLRTFRQRADAGAVGGKLVYPDGRLQEAGGLVFADGSAANFGRGANDPDAPQFSYLREVDYVSGALLATPADVFRSFGGLDPVYGFGYYEDSDYAFTLRKSGLRVYYQPESVVVHVEGGTAGTDLSAGPKRNQEMNRSLFCERWALELAAQPQRPSSPSVGVLAGIADRAVR